MKRWFLPDTPDLLAQLTALSARTVETFTAFERWSAGEDARPDLETAKDAAKATKRALLTALQEAFSAPLDPEDLFELAERIETLVRQVRDIVREAEVLEVRPDAAMAKMSGRLRGAVDLLDEAVRELKSDPAVATKRADAALVEAHHFERDYRSAMGLLLAEPDLRTVMDRRELYRRYADVAEGIARVGDRIWYALVKER